MNFIPPKGMHEVVDKFAKELKRKLAAKGISVSKKHKFTESELVVVNETIKELVNADVSDKVRAD
jgi:hypothetical protein